jgi:hypothetical protein
MPDKLSDIAGAGGDIGRGDEPLREKKRVRQ